MSVEIVQRAEDTVKATWYVFPNGRVFSYHVVVRPDGSTETFRVDDKTWPSSAVEGEYAFIRNATDIEFREHCWNEVGLTDSEFESIKALVI